MRRVQGDRGAIASSTNSCGVTLRCLAANKAPSASRDAVLRRGFDIAFNDATTPASCSRGQQVSPICFQVSRSRNSVIRRKSGSGWIVGHRNKNIHSGSPVILPESVRRSVYPYVQTSLFSARKFAARVRSSSRWPPQHFKKNRAKENTVARTTSPPAHDNVGCQGLPIGRGDSWFSSYPNFRRR